MITNKPLYTFIVLALSLVRAAPVDSDETIPQFRVIDLLPAHSGQLQVGHQSAQVTAPMDTSVPHHPKQHQVRIFVDGPAEQPFIGEFDLKQQQQVKHQHHGERNHRKPESEHSDDDDDDDDDESDLEDGICMEASEELAQHVVSLRNYIDTLDEREYSTFLDHYVDEGSEDDMLALELALELEEDEDGKLLKPVIDCEDALEYVSLKELSRHDHGHHDHTQKLLEHEIEQDMACSKEEMENGECESIESHRQARKHLHHQHNQHHDHRDHRFRKGKEIISHHLHQPLSTVQLIQADGAPVGENATRPHFHHQPNYHDADLLGPGGLHPSTMINAKAVSSPLAFSFSPMPVKREEGSADEEVLAKRSPVQVAQELFQTPVATQASLA
ncbi:hypothetical protein CBS101457_002758 [Exobasidium rhododendri]|nr:hypothetical protein CBS101457_002758 [Exobasidium rhododendri]